MEVRATVLFPMQVSFKTYTKDKEKIKERVIEESHKIFNRQFSKPVIFSSNVDICDPPEEVVLWKRK